MTIARGAAGVLFDGTPEERDRQARQYLEEHPQAWPYILAVAWAHLGLGPAATALGMSPDDFARVYHAGSDKAVRLAKQAQPAPVM